MTNPLQHQASLNQLVTFFESIEAGNTARLSQVYTDDVFFKDPFNEVRGIAAVAGIFEHMFVQVDAPRFVVTGSVLQGDQAFLTWDFLFRMKRYSGVEQCIHGGSHLVFALTAQGEWRIQSHRDYWDAAEELYEKLPLIGGLMRWLKKRVNS